MSTPVDVSDGDLIVVARAELERLRTELAAAKDNASLLRAEIARLRAAARELGARPSLTDERDALCAAILDLERADHSVHSEECDGREHVAGDNCGSDGEGGWTCCEGLSEEGCVAAERERCCCGLVAWRDKLRAAGDLARGFRAVEVSRG